MSFFSSLDDDRKKEIAEGRVLSLKEQLFGMFISAGLDPDEVDMAVFNPEDDLSEEYGGLRSAIVQIMAAIDVAETVIARIPN